jgi:dCTP deaminase
VIDSTPTIREPANLHGFCLVAVQGDCMPAMPDHWIREMAKRQLMIEPYAESRRRKGKISFGVSSYGYDFRLANEYKLPDFSVSNCLDPKKMEAMRFRDFKGRTCLIPPNSFVLGRSLEYFRIPRDVIVICQGKSTYARSGVIVNVTPLEPEWEGFITVSLINATPVPIKLYSEEGIAQLVFFKTESECDTSYADRKGKYQGQKQIRLSSV